MNYDKLGAGILYVFFRLPFVMSPPPFHSIVERKPQKKFRERKNYSSPRLQVKMSSSHQDGLGMITNKSIFFSVSNIYPN